VTDRASATNLNVSLLRGHVYELYLLVAADELTEVGPGSSSATASLNLGPGPNGTRLDSVEFS
jgi:hypothetical protein